MNYRNENDVLSALDKVKKLSGSVQKTFNGLPDELKTDPVCRKAIQYMPFCIKDVPKSFELTENVAIDVVNGNGWLLHAIPEELRSPKVCLAAVKNSDAAYKHIPNAVKDIEMTSIALRGNAFLHWMKSMYSSST